MWSASCPEDKCLSSIQRRSCCYYLSNSLISTKEEEEMGPQKLLWHRWWQITVLLLLNSRVKKLQMKNRVPLLMNIKTSGFLWKIKAGRQSGSLFTWDTVYSETHKMTFSLDSSIQIEVLLWSISALFRLLNHRYSQHCVIIAQILNSDIYVKC